MRSTRCGYDAAVSFVVSRASRARFAAVALTVITASQSAAAFTGLYVTTGDARLTSRAASVVLMRDGTRTVLTMQHSYEGPPEDFALVVPVPVVLRRDDVRTISSELFDRLDRFSAPRLVERWEQDPCASDAATPLEDFVDWRGPREDSAGEGLRGPRVDIEASFVAGEYDIVVLSATDSSSLERWLRRQRYRIPEGAGEALAPYVRAGMKFFVAKVDARRLRFEQGRATLSPLRIQYDSEVFSLPIRLGALSAPGDGELIVHVLARQKRYEAANRSNVTIETNLDVTDAARERFSDFYAALFDRTIAARPDAVVTEYAGDARSCDPCPQRTLTHAELATLGADAIPATASLYFDGPGGARVSLGSPVVRLSTPSTVGALPPDSVRRVAARNLSSLEHCYRRALAQNPSLAGTTTLSWTIDAEGAARETAASEGALGDVASCAATAVQRWRFPVPAGGGVVRARMAVEFLRDPAGHGDLFGAYPDFVLTRLHLRLNRALGDDLVLREAPAIQGGRERPASTGVGLERGATPASANAFQARYVIRHPWTGAVSCTNPRRGVWGAARPAADAAERPRSARDTAFAARGSISLESVLDAGVHVSAIADAAVGAAGDGSSAATASVSATHTQSSRCSVRGPGRHAPSGAGALLGALTALCATLSARRRARR